MLNLILLYKFVKLNLILLILYKFLNYAKFNHSLSLLLTKTLQVSRIVEDTYGHNLDDDDVFTDDDYSYGKSPKP